MSRKRTKVASQSQASPWWISLLSLLLTLSMVGLVVVGMLYRSLPAVTQLLHVSYQTPMRVLTAEGELIAEYGTIKRIPLKYDDFPKPFIQAIVATEDQRFFQHHGIDPLGLLRASLMVLKAGDTVQGASTITMQVSRNFFLEKKKTLLRKIKEILLSFDVEMHLSKKQIMELYCNQIFFGHRAYGAEAAAHVYYGKSLKELSIPELAMLAGIPQAPSKHNPLKHPEQAIKRRNHVLDRMAQQGYLSKAQALAYQKAPNTARSHQVQTSVQAMHAAEMVRAYWVQKLGEKAYTQGLEVRTTLRLAHQKAAQNAVIQGSRQKRELPYEVPSKVLHHPEKLRTWLQEQKLNPHYTWGVVSRITHDDIEVMTEKQTQRIERRHIHGLENLFIGQVVPIRHHAISQWPLMESALVNLDVRSGAITALVGGVDWRRSHFNRATQALRQPGSSFKPILVAAALQQGHKLSGIYPDEPFVAKIPGKNAYWKPQNVDKTFKGPMTLREGLVQSRNLVMIHLLARMNIDRALGFIDRMGLPKNRQPRSLAMALGAGSVNPVEMATAYAVFGHQGQRVFPYLMLEARDQNGPIDMDLEAMAPGVHTRMMRPEEQLLHAGANPVMQVQEAYWMWKVLREVVERGTARRALEIPRSDIVGKTGTTNQQQDAWFVGLGGHYAASVWCGYDQLQPLGYGSSVALPIWIDFMKVILHGEPIFQPRHDKAPEVVFEPEPGDPTYWMDGHENDDWIDPDQQDILSEIL